MGTFGFAPQVYQQPREAQKSAHPSLSFATNAPVLTVILDYVFVDEHNRHKRLKGTVNTSNHLRFVALRVTNMLACF